MAILEDDGDIDAAYETAPSQTSFGFLSVKSCSTITGECSIKWVSQNFDEDELEFYGTRAFLEYLREQKLI